MKSYQRKVQRAAYTFAATNPNADRQCAFHKKHKPNCAYCISAAAARRADADRESGNILSRK